jgi:shikimate kinase
LIKDKGREKEVQSLLRFRQPFYRSSADLKVDTTGLTVEQVVEKIIAKVKN